MKIFYGIDDLPKFENVVLTIGTFDGVHQGHKKILQSVVAEARAINGTSVLITFDPHPRKLIFPQEPLKLLSTLEERLELVADSGIDITVVVPFTMSFAAMSAQEYIQHFLISLFHPILIVIGYDHHFGHDRTGDITMLESYAQQYHFEVKEISAQLISDAAVSSTQVRKALLAGDVASAMNMLGVPYCIKGSVIHGAELGRTIGFPTANICLPEQDKLVPKIGVYAVLLSIAGLQYKGMLNIGLNPTVSNTQLLKIEVHIFNFEQDIYNEVVSISFISRLRDEQKFGGIEDLKTQLAIDKKMALLALSSY
jgi:riboflavin kinase/FMN adenylyltransferase